MKEKSTARIKEKNKKRMQVRKGVSKNQNKIAPCQNKRYMCKWNREMF